MQPSYRGRFAPSPTGSLHFGSLVTALGSYLEARKHQGIWLVRMEDLDTPRTIAGASDDILHTLEALGLTWDEEVLYQSQRTPAYAEALQKLLHSGMAYPCACSRKEIADSALHGIEGQIYPGTCRKGLPPDKQARAWRVRTDMREEAVRTERSAQTRSSIDFEDALQGHLTQHLEHEVGDFVVKRADGLFAYQLAVVVDDAFQSITHVVRGADLLTSTPRQIYLQHLLGLVTPSYLHLPIVINAQGEKLSKQTLATPVDVKKPSVALLHALAFLRQEPPAELGEYDVDSVLRWAIAHWDKDKLKGIMQLPVA
jgi:glutamyl-Q tRNA(Asp) synthetase